MKLKERILAGLKSTFSSRSSESTTSCLQVSNLKRRTVLADCVEIADSSAKRNKGLLGRERLGFGEGLWIVPCQAVHTFGMRFTIDLVYLNRANQVKKVRSSVPPWRLSACLSAYSVLELPAGVVKTSQTERGDQLKFLYESVQEGKPVPPQSN